MFVEFMGGGLHGEFVVAQCKFDELNFEVRVGLWVVHP